LKIVKTFRVRVSLGNGKPLDIEIKAASGPEAQDIAKAQHPGAMHIHILGYAAPPQVIAPKKPKVELPPPPPPIDFADDDPNIPLEVRDCLRMYKLGLSHRAIAAQLNIGKTTVGDWLKLYGLENYSLNENDKGFSSVQNWGPGGGAPESDDDSGFTV
jgi:hypothetical protein